MLTLIAAGPPSVAGADPDPTPSQTHAPPSGAAPGPSAAASAVPSPGAAPGPKAAIDHDGTFAVGSDIAPGVSFFSARAPALRLRSAVVISVAAAGYFKPHFATYAKAAEIVGEDRARILFVANHAFDCIGAKASGLRTAFIDRRKRPFGETPHRPDLIVPDFSALAGALEP